MNRAGNPRTTPTGIELVGETGMEISWQDGHLSRFGSDQLRAECPCAGCRQERTGQGEVAISIGAPLPLLPKRARGGVRILGVEPVGYYAIRIAFSDSHDSGIFTFDYLRALDSGGVESPGGGGD